MAILCQKTQLCFLTFLLCICCFKKLISLLSDQKILAQETKYSISYKWMDDIAPVKTKNPQPPQPSRASPRNEQTWEGEEKSRDVEMSLCIQSRDVEMSQHRCISINLISLTLCISRLTITIFYDPYNFAMSIIIIIIIIIMKLLYNLH